MIYFDNAATTHTKPNSVIEAVNKAIRQHSANPGRSGHKLSLSVSEMVYKTREKVASFFGAKSYENVVFTANCTMSINIVMNGLFKKGDHFLISDLEHNSVARTAYSLAEKGVEFNVFETSFDDEETIANIKVKLKKNTKGIVCTHGSNVFGIKLPIKRIGEFCKLNNLYYIVDAAQTAGIEPIDVLLDNIDYLCIAPHKGLYAPMGTGILITDDKPAPFVCGGTGSNSKLYTQPEFLPDKFESGTLNVPGIAGIGAGLDFVKQNKRIIIEKEMTIISYLYNELSKCEKVELYNKPTLPVLSFNIKGEESEKVSSYLNDNNICVRAGLHCAPLAHKKFNTIKSGTVRISPSFFNSLLEAKRVVCLVNKYN